MPIDMQPVKRSKCWNVASVQESYFTA